MTSNQNRRSPFALVVAAFACLAVSACSSGGPGSSAQEHWNVLLITLDTTRADHIGCYGHETSQTPVLDGLAADGTRFDHAIAQAPITLPTHASILTGLEPQRHGARCNGLYTLSDRNETLQEILSDEGFQTAAVVAAFVLDSRFGLAQGFDEYDDDTESMAKTIEFQDPSRPGSAVTDAALRIADTFDTSRPYFLWAHYFDPHFPYEPPAPFASRFPNDRHGRYLAEIASMDAQIGRLLDGLESRRLLEKTLVVVIADHGEGFPGPHDEDSHGFYVYDDTIHIPFIVSQRGGDLPRDRVSTRLAAQVDVVPTVLDLLGLPAPPEIDGVSLAAEIRGASDASGDDVSGSDASASGDTSPPDDEDLARAAYAEAVSPWYAYGWATLYQLRTTRWKYIEAPTPLLFDLVRDPGEQVDVSSEEPEVVARMKNELDRRIARAAEGDSSRELSAGDIARLNALGYMPDASGPTIAPRTGTDNRALKDPHEWLDVHMQIKSVDTIYLSGRLDEAIRELEKVLERDPDNYRVHEHLGMFYEKREDFDKAIASYREMTRIRPQGAMGFDRLGDALQQESNRLAAQNRMDAAAARLDEAVRQWKIAIELGTLEFNAMLHVGIHHLKRQEWDDAEGVLRKGLAVAPEGFDLLRFLAMALAGKNEHEEARKLFERALAIAGDNVEESNAVRGQLYQTCLALGDNASAADHLDAIARSMPQGAQRTQIEAMAQRIRSGG